LGQLFLVREFLDVDLFFFWLDGLTWCCCVMAKERPQEKKRPGYQVKALAYPVVYPKLLALVAAFEAKAESPGHQPISW
jgi:hypothetical protein